MNEIKAYQCEYTNMIFADPRDAARSEFRALCRKAAGHMPCMGSVAPRDIADWLSSNLASGVYPLAADAWFDALTYFRANRETIGSNGQQTGDE